MENSMVVNNLEIELLYDQAVPLLEIYIYIYISALCI